MASAHMRCEIVSAEEEIFSGQVEMVSIRGTLGDLGIFPGHAPLLTGIRPGPVRIKLAGGEEAIYFANGGYLEIQPGIVTILADTAVHASDVDEAAAAEARSVAVRDMAEAAADIDQARAMALLADAAGRERTLEELRKKRR